MIVYDLACAQGHKFEGWFDSADAFAQQQAKALVRCPICDTEHVERIPSARVNVSKSIAPKSEPKPEAKPKQPEPHPMVAGLPPELVAKLREVVRSTENVGHRFPEEARKIHYEEVPARPIRGQASAEEAEALRDEGIDFAPVPPFLLEEPH